LHGGGANAKSWLLGLLCTTFDVYGLTWNTSILVNDFSGESANPELAEGEYKRFIQIQEAKKNKALNMENIKKLTGYDQIRARKLWENGKNFVIIANIFLSVNDLPLVTETDDGTWRRMNVITFTSKFVQDPDKVDEERHIYLADMDAKKEHEDYAPYMMSLLVEYYKRLKREGNTTPQCIRDDTMRFKDENDIYSAFFTDRCILDESGRIHVEELWKACQDWGRNQNNRNIQVSRSDMLKWFNSLGTTEGSEFVEYHQALRVNKTIAGKMMSKVTTGFTGVHLNKFQVVKEEPDGEEEPEDDVPSKKTAYGGYPSYL
jgi:putative DNA primase/helicase